MFGKSAFIVRTLFVVFTVGSLVACTFDGGTPESEGHTTSADSKTKKANSGADASADDDASTPIINPCDDNNDAGPGPYDPSADASAGDYDGGPGDWGNDASADDAGPFNPGDGGGF